MARRYQAAAKGSKPIVNEGQRVVKFITDKGEKRKMTCQVAGVNKIHASVAQVCDGGTTSSSGTTAVRSSTLPRTSARLSAGSGIFISWTLGSRRTWEKRPRTLTLIWVSAGQKLDDSVDNFCKSARQSFFESRG